MTANFIYELGEYGPIILIIISYYLLWDKSNLFFYYNVGLLSNSIFNLILKGIIQQPRPLYDSKKMMLVKTHAKNYYFQNGIPFDMFGMPSGHAQAAFYSVVFIYLALKQTNVMYFYLPLALLTCYQRVAKNYHTVNQIIIGSIVGGSYAYFVYWLSKEKIKGIIREKPDDNGPV